MSLDISPWPRFCQRVAEEKWSFMVNPFCTGQKHLGTHRLPAAGTLGVAAVKYAG
jgi:hypothetical protein